MSASAHFVVGIAPSLRHPPRAFSAIELLAVLTVIALLLGLAWPVSMHVIAKSRIAATQQAVDGAAVAAAGLSAPTVTDADGRVRRLWDLNADGILDGDPERDEAFSDADRAAAAAVQYRGFLASVGTRFDARRTDRRSGRPLDAWGNHLRIAFAREVYGAAGFGIWSFGPDRLDATADDIRSWKAER